MDTKTCQTCKYAENHEYYAYLFCHRFPPVNLQFPSTKRTDWCGEYVPDVPEYVEGI